MAQAFSTRALLTLKLGFVGVVAAVVVLALSWHVDAGHPQGEPMQQVVPFSHKHHVADDGLDCRFCHATVETSAFAGLPPVSTCMGCHSLLYTDQPALRPVIEAWQGGVPLRWARVHQLPDFVYFDHSIHVAKGVGCSTCHGQVEQMPLTWRNASLHMAWCVDCHRHPQRALRPQDRVFDMTWQAPPDQEARGAALAAAYRIATPRRLTECSICHR